LTHSRAVFEYGHPESRADADKVESDADGIPEKRTNTSTATADATLAADAAASLGARSQLNICIYAPPPIIFAGSLLLVLSS